MLLSNENDKINDSDSKKEINNKELGIIDNFFKENKVSLISKNQIEEEEENILKEYANSESNNIPIFYVAGFSSKMNDFVIW